ncbi:tumor protein p53-inducible protein 13 isoform X3 [Tachyglossus aculeatus]|uniref:tumor protein p53-inducible protein 13 isoform X3 n=1 Tax=Tachyglossus aculeatus TaxID=9261 RepID=UPI0018F2AE34|nr:tumor protein p53-inducible protein 13 isoform X3 [Tachyglossus aculeatus]
MAPEGTVRPSFIPLALGLQVSFELDKVPQCPGEPWPLPREVPPTVVTRDTGQSYRDQGRGLAFIYHPCAHPWLQLQLTLLARACVPRPVLVPALGLTRERPLALAAWGVVLEMARVEPAQAAQWLWRRKRRALADTLGPRRHPTLARGRRRLCPGEGMQALAMALALQPWRLSGREAVRAPPVSASTERPAPPGARRRPPRDAQEATPSPADPLGEAANVTVVTGAPGPARPTGRRGDALQTEEGEGGSNGSRAQLLGPGTREGCACPEKAPQASQAAQRVRGPTPRTEEAAWAATALTFLLVVLTLGVLCARLHRNVRRGHSLYWEPGPTPDGQDTVAAVLKRRLLPGPGRHKRWRRSRQRPLLPSTPDSDSSDD